MLILEKIKSNNFFIQFRSKLKISKQQIKNRIGGDKMYEMLSKTIH